MLATLGIVLLRAGVASGTHRSTSAPTRPATSPSAASTSDVASAVDPHDGEIPNVELSLSLAAMTVALVLGVGLIVHRAGDRGERIR